MYTTTLLVAIAGLASAATTGQYASGYKSDASLPKHTIYAPTNAPPGTKLPVLIWGNGACSSNGLLFQKSLLEVASHGYFAIANGPAKGGSGSTSSISGGPGRGKWNAEALDWVVKNAGKGAYANVDTTRIAAAGQSCGGLETYVFANEPKVHALGIFNSGEFSLGIAKTLKKPVFYFLGGKSDVAYENGERDYKNLPASTPRWKGSLDVGHMATWSQPNSGTFGRAEVAWLNYVLKGNATAASWFTGNGAESEGWAVEKAALDKFVPAGGAAAVAGGAGVAEADVEVEAEAEVEVPAAAAPAAGSPKGERLKGLLAALKSKAKGSRSGFAPPTRKWAGF